MPHLAEVHFQGAALLRRLLHAEGGAELRLPGHRDHGQCGAGACHLRDQGGVIGLHPHLPGALHAALLLAMHAGGAHLQLRGQDLPGPRQLPRPGEAGHKGQPNYF